MEADEPVNGCKSCYRGKVSFHVIKNKYLQKCVKYDVMGKKKKKKKG